MTDAAPAVPKHLWIVGVLSLLWNAVGAWDYLMTQTQNAAYMGSFTQPQLDFFYGLPTWVVALWATAVWGGVLGSLLLLARKRVATTVFLVSLVCAVLVGIQNFALSNGFEVMGTGGAAFSAVIVVVAFLLWRYAEKVQRLGVLR